MLLDPNTKAEEIHKIIESIPWNEKDDITRVLYFQSKAFPGIAKEKSQISSVLHELSVFSNKETKRVIFSELERTQAEKSLHRLLIIGVISDYTIKYSSDEFSIALTGNDKKSIIEEYSQYVAGYLVGRKQGEIEKAKKLLTLPFNDFVIEIIELLLQFIYDVIERGRRRALQEMVLAATESPTDSSIRSRILQYLDASQYSEDLEQILSDSGAGLEKTIKTFEVVRSPNESAELRGLVSRYLGSYPDHPGFLMLRSLSEIYCRDKNSEITEQNFLASISFAEEKYGISDQPLYNFIVWALSKISDRSIELAQEIQIKLIEKYPNRALARSFIENSSIPLATVPAWILINRLVHKAKNILSQ